MKNEDCEKNNHLDFCAFCYWCILMCIVNGANCVSWFVFKHVYEVRASGFGHLMESEGKILDISVVKEALLQ